MQGLTRRRPADGYGPRLSFSVLVAAVISLAFPKPAIPAFGISGIQLTDLLLLCVVLLWLVEKVLRKEVPRLNGLFTVSVLFIAVFAVSTLAAGRESALLKLGAFSMYIMLPWLMTQVVRQREDLFRLVQVLAAVTVLAALVAFASAVAFYLGAEIPDSLECPFGDVPGPQDIYARVCLPFGHPNLLASFLTVGVAYLVMVGNLFLKRWQLAVAVGVVALVALATLSTGVGGFALTLALAVAGGVWMTGRSLSKSHVLLLALATIGAGLLSVATIGHQVPEGEGQIRIGSAEWSFGKGPRPYMWMTTIDAIASRPLIGSGYGSLPAKEPELWKYWYGAEDMDELSGVASTPTNAHNVWLNVGGRAGLLGLGFFILLVAHSVRGVSLRGSDGDPLFSRCRVATAAALMGGFFFHGLFEALEGARHIWLLLGLAAVTSSLHLEQADAQNIGRVAQTGPS